jgi:hypothetical protein
MAWQDKPIQAIGGGLLSYWDELKEMLGKGAGRTGINVGGGVMDAATGIGARALGSEQETDFMQKMNWLENNPNASNYELQLLGITPETKSEFEQKMQWLRSNPDATQQELGVLGIGARGLNTPAEREYLASVMSGNEATSAFSDKVKYVAELLKEVGISPNSQQYQQMMHKMLSGGVLSGVGARGLNTEAERNFLNAKYDTTKDWTFDVDGKTEAYTFSGDAMPSAEAVQNMRDKYGITGQGQLLNNWQDKATAQASDTKQQMFENKLNQLDSAQLDQVMRVMSPMTPEQKERFVSDVINGQVSLTGYGIQDEGQAWGELTPNFAPQQMQYQTGTTLPNLGFAGY